MKAKKITSLLLCLSLVLICFTSCGGEEAAPVSVLTNGIIYTIEGDDWENNTKDTIVYDEAGTILFVGSAEDAKDKGYMGDNAAITDLAGKVVMPGLIDSHNHPIGTALTELFEINLYYDFDKEGSMETVAKFVKENPDLDIYWGDGFNMGMVDENGNPPSKEWLDEICPDTPMILSSNDGHNKLLNMAALELCGIDASTKTPTGGNIHKGADGNPTGLLTDCGSLVQVEHEYTDEQITEGTALYLDTMNAWGYTSISSAGSLIDDSLEDFLALEEAGDLTLRINYSEMIQPENYKEGIENLIEEKETVKSDFIKISTAKFFEDGVIEGVTGYLLEPYAKEAGMGDNYVSEPIWTNAVLADAMTMALDGDLQIHVHSIGDAATRAVLDCIEQAQATHGDADYRNVITHLQVVNDADKPRFGELGIIAAIQPFWHMQEPDWYENVDKLVLGEDRAWKEYPVKSLLDNGAIITSSGDYPVSPTNNPFWGIESGVTRNLNNAEFYGVDDIANMDDPKWLLNAEERVSLKTMVEAYTINGAYQMFRDDEIGSLAEGKKADLVVLDKDMFKIDPIAIDGVKVLATILDGNVVYGEL